MTFDQVGQDDEMQNSHAKATFQFILIMTSILYMIFLILYSIIYLPIGKNNKLKPIAFLFFTGNALQRKTQHIIYWPSPLDEFFSYLILVSLILIISLLFFRMALTKLSLLDDDNQVEALRAYLKGQWNSKNETQITSRSMRNNLIYSLIGTTFYSLGFLFFISTTFQGLIGNSTTNDLVLLVLGLGGGSILSILVGITGILTGMGGRLGNTGFILYFFLLTIFVVFIELIIVGNMTFGSLPLAMAAFGIVGGGVGFLGGMIILDKKFLPSQTT